MKQIHNRSYLKEHRTSNRKHLTPAEAFLWSHLKGRQLNGKKFCRQHSIENYIVDFYCPEYLTIVEVDGGYHNEPAQIEQDAIRDARLRELGCTIVRFDNKFVFENLDWVLAEIKSCFDAPRRFKSKIAD
jgi:very-short-patch-repair endonuclease